jgi:hypothetical protein
MGSRGAAAGAVLAVFACVLLLYPFYPNLSDSVDDPENTIATNTLASYQIELPAVQDSKVEGTQLAVFRGKEAKLNLAIMKILSHNSPMTIYDFYKLIRPKRGIKLRYATVNARVRALERDGYLRKAGSKETKAGFMVTLYEATAIALFAQVFRATNFDNLILELSETAALTIVSAIKAAEC